MISKQNMLKQWGSLILSGFFVLATVCFSLLIASAGVVMLGLLLSYFLTTLFHGEIMNVFHYVLIVLAISCTAGLGIPILLLARNIQRSTENFSLLQFDEEAEEDDDYEGDDELDFAEDKEELNEFLKKLHKTRNIGPFIPSPKTMDDLCPCGSGLKYKDCCGKFWQ